MVDAAVLDPAVGALLGTVLASSLLGSAHCAGMCGGLALAAIGPQDGARAPRQVGYHLGRLASYALLGAAAGLAGGAVDDVGILVGTQRVAAMVAGLGIAAFGLAAIARSLGARVPRAGVPRAMVALAQRVHSWTLRLPPRFRGVPIGLATPLLPCGWLFAFAAIAAASAAPSTGALVMAAFWLGTVPAVVIASNGARVVFSRLGRAAPIAMGLAMVAVGLHAAFVRGASAGQVIEDARAAAHAGEAATLANLAQRADAERDEVPACCRTAR
jgi:uncharacterized protein